jgi:hypothetical protein
MSRALAVEIEWCRECGASISDGEYVVNWGSCGVCFDAHLDAYERSPRAIARRAVEEQGIGE